MQFAFLNKLKWNDWKPIFSPQYCKTNLQLNYWTHKFEFNQSNQILIRNGVKSHFNASEFQATANVAVDGHWRSDVWGVKILFNPLYTSMASEKNIAPRPPCTLFPLTQILSSFLRLIDFIAKCLLVTFSNFRSYTSKEEWERRKERMNKGEEDGKEQTHLSHEHRRVQRVGGKTNGRWACAIDERESE